MMVSPDMATNRNGDGIELTTDLAEAFRRASKLDESPETLEEGFKSLATRLGNTGVTLAPKDMYQSAPTRHSIRFGETVEYVPCVMDALMIAEVIDARPIEIHSEPPGGGETIRFRITGDEVAVTPTGAVVTFGLGLEEARDSDLKDLKDSLNDPDSPPLTVCTVINAFPDSESYEEWEGDVSNAAVMKLGVEDLIALSQEAARSYVTAPST